MSTERALVEIHVVQNHCPSNLNRDDLGAPKTCYFGGVLRSRISSQCIKRSIRKSKVFERLAGGLRTRRLAQAIASHLPENMKARARAEKVLEICGIKPRKAKKGQEDESEIADGDSRMLVFTTQAAIKDMADLITKADGKPDEEIANDFARLIAERVAVPDIALFGRMLEPDTSDKIAKNIWKNLNTSVEAAAQVAHAISTHEARPEVDYYVAVDDIPGDDAGAGYLDEALFASACFYKYFSINWHTLVRNLAGFGENSRLLAAHTVGALIKAAALVNPAGKQNSYASNCPPAGMLVEIRDFPVSYANAFAEPAVRGERGLVPESIAKLATYVRDIEVGFGPPRTRFWFSPNGRHRLTVVEEKKESSLVEESCNSKSLDDLTPAVIRELGYDWDKVQKVVVNPEANL